MKIHRLNLMRDKQGNIFSILIFVAIIIAVAVGVYFVSFLNNQIFSEIDNSGIVADNPQANATVNQAKDEAIAIGDNIIFWVVLGFFIALIAMAVYLEFDPVIVGIFLVLGLIAVVFSMQAVNFQDDLNTQLSPDIQGESSFTLSNALFSKAFPIILLGVIALVIIIMYSKSRAGGAF